MTSSDWIALAQALFLLLATFLSWRAYRLSAGEHRESREEVRKAPLRSLYPRLIAKGGG